MAKYHYIGQSLEHLSLIDPEENGKMTVVIRRLYLENVGN